MANAYFLSTKQYDDGEYIHFHNTTNAFIEVIFTNNGLELRTNQMLHNNSKGYGYAPKLEKSVRKNKAGGIDSC